MPIKDDHSRVIIAGATGLVGHHLLTELSAHSAIDTIYTLLRRQPDDALFTAPQVITLVNPTLTITQWQENTPPPNIGYICLGSTLKQAGSKSALEQVDYHLVCQVAKQMQVLGVQRLAVISCFGAAPDSKSHYLRCKGRMEQSLSQMGFKQLYLFRPGPIEGKRRQTRLNEQLLTPLLKGLSPLMHGKLQNFSPILASDIALSMLYASFTDNPSAIQIFDSVAMRGLLRQYR